MKLKEKKMKKLSNLLMVTLLIVLMFGIVSACKSVKKFDIIGSWSINWQMLGEQIQSIFIFNGAKESGSITCNSYSGTYTVNNDIVKIELIVNGVRFKFDGNSTGENSMSGNVTSTYLGYDFFGTWSATRQGSYSSTHRKSETINVFAFIEKLKLKVNSI